MADVNADTVQQRQRLGAIVAAGVVDQRQAEALAGGDAHGIQHLRHHVAGAHHVRHHRFDQLILLAAVDFGTE